ncbi:hypothetical protein ACFOY2_04980 [Nonomuraea purpurea]|uniref:Uncharacterized protein n=1 Tax=Nonomuraea purpurea TaxID=1849276 RepID=A0ABV8G1X4_9ACTN
MDDAFDDHEKVLALLDLDEGIAAIGLWTLCFTWAHRNTRKKGKTPGLLPSTLPRRFVGARGKDLARLLVDAGMWDVVSDGWMIHDFVDYLPDKEVSAARSEAGKKGAAARWGNKKSDSNLPSGDGKPNGKADGRDMAAPVSGESDDAVTPVEDPVNSPDGNQPSRDSNLPSGSHPGDGKAVASDGSRAGARWERVDVGTTELFPIPSPRPAQPSAAEPAARPERDPLDVIAGLTLTQRSKRITDAYAEAEPMCKWPAINGIVLKALKAEKYADSEVRDALLRLAKEGRSVSVETLRVELQGQPPRNRDAPTGGSRNAQILSAAMERAVRAEQQRVNATIPKGEIPA